MTTDLADKPANVPARRGGGGGSGGGAVLDGATATDLILPQAHLFQGLPSEKDLYGRHEEGDWIDTLSREKLPSTRFVPVSGFVDFVRYKEPRGSGIEYIERDPANVPPEDLEWDRANNLPPACQRRLNWIVLFEGMATPLVLVFKSTSVRCGQTINSLEKLRGNRGPGFYELESRTRQNNKGKWLDPQVRPIGDPPAELAAAAREMFAGLRGVNVVMEEDLSGGTGDGTANGSDQIPI